jgi:hypothetical protein
LSLIVANLVPVFGVLFLGWDVGAILSLYWLESVVIGVLNIPKILAANGNVFGKVFNCAFFSAHYGAFCSGHGLFLHELFGVDLSWQALFVSGPMSIAAISFFISHFVSMMVNYFGKGEYRKRTASEQMFIPYGRVIVMHITILGGGLLMQTFGAPVFALFMLIALKIFIDLVAHNMEHQENTEGETE